MSMTTIEAAMLPKEFAGRATFTIKEVAALLLVSENTLRRAIAAGLVHTIKVGSRRIAIPRNEVNRLLTEGM